MLVEQVHTKSVDRVTDPAAGQRTRARPVEFEMGDVHRRLGDAVHVDECRRGFRVTFVPRVIVVPAPESTQVQGFATEDHVPEPGLRIGSKVGFDVLVEGRGRLIEHGDAFCGDQRPEGVRVA